MTPIRTVVVGAGGHAKVVIEAMRAAGRFDIVGLVDPKGIGTEVLGVTVLGGDDILDALRGDGVDAAVIALGDNATRQRIGRSLGAKGYVLPAIVHPAALLSPSATIGEGVTVMARAVIGTSTRIGALAIINTGAIVDHDGRVDEAAHVATAAALAGVVSVGERALIGAGSVVRPGLRVGADAVVGVGSAVVRDVAAGERVGGVPARPLRAAPDRSPAS